MTNKRSTASNSEEITATPVLPSSSESAVRQRKAKKPPSRQQIMLRQMKAQQDLEKEQNKFVQAYTGVAFSDQLLKLVRTMLLVFLVGAGALYYSAPGLVNKWIRRKPELPNRSLISVYPEYVNIKRDLPRFFHEYSLATPENLPARQAIRHIASLRKMATNPGSKYKQKIMLWPWELDQFRRQLPNADALNQYCGKGTEAIYQNRPELREEIVLWCLLGSAHDHGFVRFDVQQVYGSISRGIKGVAVRYDGHPNRAMARSILLLPFHSPEALRKGKALPPSTKVALRTMSWLRQNAPLIASFDELVDAMEDFLFWAISQEEDSWHWFHAACTPSERQAREGEPRVASMCTEQQEEEGRDCCVIFDPNMHEFYGRGRPKRFSRENQA